MKFTSAQLVLEILRRSKYPGADKLSKNPSPQDLFDFLVKSP